jgi:hypothetical protein
MLKWHDHPKFFKYIFWSISHSFYMQMVLINLQKKFMSPPFWNKSFVAKEPSFTFDVFHVSSLSPYIDLLHATNKGLRTNLLLFNICDFFCGPHLWLLFSSLDVNTLLFFFSFLERVFFYKIKFGNVSSFLCLQLKAFNNLCFVPINHFLLDKS